jgi:hypothetical protein
MNSWSLKALFTLASISVVAACDIGIAPKTFLPGKGVQIVVDSAVYHLQTLQPGQYQVKVAVTVVNASDHDVYLAQHCGYYSLNWADRSTAWLELGAYACAAIGGGPVPAPLPIAAGDSYTRVFNFRGSLQPQARPQITLENNIGVMKFRYRFTNPTATTGVSVESAPFTVLPPI